VSIKSDGLFHEKVQEGTPGAVFREYELKDGTKGSKWELLYRSLDNYRITDIKFEDSDYGENILLTLDDGEEKLVWAENTGGNFGSDLMKKRPNLDFSQTVSFKPYVFEDNGRRGVSVFQSDKISDFFWDGENKLHGFPEWQKEDMRDMTKDDWKMYFLQVKMFLTDYIKKEILPKFAGVSVAETDELAGEFKGDEIEPKDIPF